MTTLSVRPMQEDDVVFIVDYWLQNTDENLLRMGTDKTKLPSSQEFTQSLLALCKQPIEKMQTFYMIWLIDNKPVGYNSLKAIFINEIANIHLHMWDAQYRGKGYGAKLFCLAAIELYRLFDLKMMLCEPWASNPMPNKMLEKIGFQKWKTYFSTPAEIALTCELNSYIINAETAAGYLSHN